MNKPEKLILDYSKWRCGSDGPTGLGKGYTALLNDEGYGCCIGQWSIQCGASNEDILNIKSPESIKEYEVDLFIKKDPFKRNNLLAYNCMEINDSTNTTPEIKIELLKNRLGEEGIQLEVINKP